MNPEMTPHPENGPSPMSPVVPVEAEVLRRLRESEEKFRTVFSLVADGIVIHEAETGRLLDFNDRACELFGYTREEFARADLDQLSEGPPLYTRARALEYIREALQGRPQVFEWRSRAKDGRVFWSEVSMRAARIGEAQRVLVIVRDIHHRKCVEERLRASEERFHSLFANMAEGAALHETVYDEAGRPVNYRILDVNPRFESILGLSRDQVVGKLATEAYGTPTAPYLEEFAAVGESGEARSLEVFFEPMAKHFAISVAPLRRGQWATIFTDITERKHAEDLLVAAARQWQTTFDAVADAICLLDLDHRILRCNKATAKLLGKETRDIVGRPCSEVFHGQSAPIACCPVQEAMTSGQRHSTEIHLGGRFYLVSADPLVNEQGVPKGTVHILSDVTERKAVERDLRIKEAAIAASANGIAISDPEGHLTYVNPAFLRLWDLGHESEALGRHVREFWADRKAAAAVLEELQRTGTWIGELEALRASGERRTISVVASLVSDHGRPLCMMASFLDITERKELESQLRQAQKLEGIGQLAGGVAHDFNNLLTVILGNVSLLLNKPGLDAADRETLQQVMEAGERAANLTRQLLTFGRKQPIRTEPLDLNEVVNGLVRMLQRVIREDIRLVVRHAPALPTVRGDPALLTQVLLNLAVNARDAMPEGGRLSVSTEVVTLDAARAHRHAAVEGATYVRLSVQDNGEGIAPHVLPRIFEPFFTTKPVGQGTGLGLATAYGIAEQHHGWIEVESSVGVGSTFSVFLPASTDNSPTIAASRPSAVPPRGAETILLVEDETGVCNLAKSCLERCGYRVLTAHDAGTAMRLWFQHRQSIDLLLTDIIMPGGMSGRQLADRLKGQKPTLKVLYTSGYTVEHPEDSEDGPAGPFLPKPYDLTVLADTVRRCLDSD